MSRAHYEQLTLSLEIDIDPCHDDGSVTAIRSVTCQLLDCYYYCHCVTLMRSVSVIWTPVHDLGLHALLVSALPSALPLPCFSAHKVETFIQQVSWRPGPGPSDLNKATLNSDLYIIAAYTAHTLIMLLPKTLKVRAIKDTMALVADSIVRARELCRSALICLQDAAC